VTNRPSHAFPSCYIATRLRFEEDISALARVPSVTASAAIRWFGDHQLHMTVCYLGWLTRATATALAALVAQCPAAPPERVRLTGQLSIVGDRLTQSLIAPIECTQELTALRGVVEEMVAQVAEDGDSQSYLPIPPFSPHVTLGRVSPDLSDASAWAISPAAAASGGLELREGLVMWAPVPSSADGPRPGPYDASGGTA
jgi:2'-5' RNA ligase